MGYGLNYPSISLCPLFNQTKPALFLCVCVCEWMNQMDAIVTSFSLFSCFKVWKLSMSLFITLKHTPSCVYYHFQTLRKQPPPHTGMCFLLTKMQWGPLITNWILPRNLLFLDSLKEELLIDSQTPDRCTTTFVCQNQNQSQSITHTWPTSVPSHPQLIRYRCFVTVLHVLSGCTSFTLWHQTRKHKDLMMTRREDEDYRNFKSKKLWRSVGNWDYVEGHTQP